MIDLDALAPEIGLPDEAVQPLAYRATIALQRRHMSGVALSALVRGREVSEELRWAGREPTLASFEDFNRVTEEGAEAIALALACSGSQLRARRRLQSRLAEKADWLLRDRATGAAVVLEVGGTDEGELDALLRRKVQQARQSPFSTRGAVAACVVRFLEPRAILWSDDEPR